MNRVSAYYVPGIVWDIWNKTVNKMFLKIPGPWLAQILVEK